MPPQETIDAMQEAINATKNSLHKARQERDAAIAKLEQVGGRLIALELDNRPINKNARINSIARDALFFASAARHEEEVQE